MPALAKEFVSLVFQKNQQIFTGFIFRLETEELERWDTSYGCFLVSFMD